MVRVAVLGEPRVALAEGLDRLRLTVSAPSVWPSLVMVTGKVLSVVSPSTQDRVPDAGW